MTELIIALFALTLMEIVLGIDNIVFISIQTSKLPKEQRARGRWLGLAIAMGTRIALLLVINWIMQLTAPAFTLSNFGIATGWLLEEHHEEINVVTYRDIILLVGGLFLINSSVREIHAKVEGHEHDHESEGVEGVTFSSVLIQIGLLDIIFSLDSVITAVGMVGNADNPHHQKYGLGVMITAIMISVFVMMFFAGAVSQFVEKHPTVKMLALSFLLLIGVMLVAEAAGTHIDKGYIYFAMGFSLLVEAFNLRAAGKKKSVVSSQ